MHSTHGSWLTHLSSPLHQIDPHPDQATSTAEHRLDTCPSRWEMHGTSPKRLGFRSFHFCLSPNDSDWSLCCHHREKTTLYGKTRSKGAGVTGKLPDPDIRPPWWTRHVGLSLQSFVKVVIFLMLFGKGWQRTRRPCPRSEEKCKKTLRPQPFTVQLRETRFLILIFLHKFVFLVWVLKSVIVYFSF